MFYLFVSRILNRLGWANMALLIMGLALLPFVVLAAYCHPSADDFWLTNMVLAKGPWQAQLAIRHNWSGRYTAMFVGSFNPLVYRSFTWYKLLPVVFLLLLVTGFYQLIQGLTNAPFSRKIKLGFALLFLIIYLHQMPTVAQTIYWMSGAITYQLANILLLFFLAGLLNYYKKATLENSLRQKIWITLTLFAAIGCNETSMLMLAFLMGCFVVLGTFRRQTDYFLLWLLVVTIIASSLVIWAPGNAVRAQDYPLQHDFSFALWHALVVPVNNSLNWLLNSPVLIISIFFIPIAAKWLPVPNILTKVHPVMAFFIWYGCLASGYFVAYWSKHGPSPPRAQDTIYFFFLLGWLANFLVLAQFLRQNYVLSPVPGYAAKLLLLWGICFLFLSQQSNIRTAYADLFSGRAARYDQEMRERYATLHHSSCQVCPVKTAKNRPETIFFEEVTADTTWENTFYARYFGKKLLLVSE